MKSRFALVSLGIAAMAFVMALHAADDTAPKKTDASAQVREDVTLQEQILARQFAEFQQSLLRLKQKLERSPKLEDRERAKILDRVIQKAKDELISTQFSQLVDFLRDQRFSNLGDIKKAVDQSKGLAEDLRAILALLREDTRAAQLRDERLALEKLLEKIQKAIETQKAVQGQTDLGKTEKVELKNLQGKATKQTEEIARAMEGGKEAANLKGDPKGAGKDSGKSGKGKDEGEAGKAGKGKDGGKQEDGEKKADAKGGKEGSEGSKSPEGKKDGAESGKAKEGKSSDGSDSKQSGAKSSQSGSEGQKGGSKDNPKGGDDKKDGKEAQAKEAGGDEGAKIKTKTKEQDPSEKDDKEAKAGSKSGGQQGGEKKEGGAKSSQSQQQQQAEQKKSGQQQQGEAKSGSESQGQGQPKSGPQQQQQQQAGSKSGGQQPQQQGEKKPQDDVANSKKQVEDANYKQQQAEEKIAKEENKDASEKQGQAIKDLESAKKKLEDLLRQIREEELERLLAALQQRCERMLAMQIAVLHGTEQTDKGIKVNPDKKASRKNEQDSLKLSDDEKEIVREADKAIEMLEAEGSAVAFPEVFQQVREDMKHVQRRLGVVDVGVVTQAIENDIIDTLKEMIEALKKARQENQSKSGQPKDGQPPPQADQKLLDQIAELKMIRSMQIRVNTRTETYGKQYEGEQAAEANIRNELQNLAERQDRIVTVTSQIAKGANQ